MNTASAVQKDSSTNRHPPCKGPKNTQLSLGVIPALPSLRPQPMYSSWDASSLCHTVTVHADTAQVLRYKQLSWACTVWHVTVASFAAHSMP
jgi:hypothetical protein